MTLSNQELEKINGGSTSTLSATFLNAVARLGTFVFDLGQALGGAIRRSVSGKKCPL